ncbi:hypothetical protein MSG28_000922 [Choristoneura fumiferana]|uniref:Uncharacterized protein n=1 Tax=Choristoneura fumiferana TaxID=7141 RepID=A0ACC0K302_CHOFU|nr:hypothetical protein MSG28_000922 [Choristoneura fumiferana]
MTERWTMVCVHDLTGVVLLIVGIVVLVKNTEYEDLITNRFFTLPGFAVATGVVILFVSVLGYYAAISEKFYFIAGYVALLLVILIFEMSITIAAFKLKDEATSAIRAPMVASIQLYESRRDIARLWDELHRDIILTAISGWLAWRSKFETVELES